MKHSTLPLHKYVAGWLVLLAAFAVTFPVAMSRVANSKAFPGQPLNSLTCEGQVPAQPTLTQFSSCAKLKVAVKPKA